VKEEAVVVALLEDGDLISSPLISSLHVCLPRRYAFNSGLCRDHPGRDLLVGLLCGLDEEHLLLHTVSRW